jgi:hypothetical protein
MSSSTDNVSEMIMNASEFNPKMDITFADHKVNPKTSGKSVGIVNNKTKSSLKLRFPLSLTWGAQLYTDPSSGRESYSMSIQFPGDGYKTPQTDKWLTNMTEMEDVVLTHVMANWKKLFNKPAPSKEAAEVLYTRSLKYSRDPNTGEVNTTKSPTMKVKLGYWDNKFDCEIYNADGKMLFSQETHPNSSPLELIPKASQTAVIVQCGGIWFAGGKFGVTWKLLQAVVKPKPSLKGRCLISLTQEDKAVISTQEIVADEEDHDSSVGGLVIAEDSDDEAEEQEQPAVVAPAPAPVVKAPEPVVTPAPVEKKKMVVKKKVKTDE